ncbi:hypothetical protein J0A67_03050 [Algoriphagus aestuariicola]|uniref:Beta-hexosaminidase bacterial type N-terminal domain-containing protein n=1 Tax=Algoriphagus aestuariicola TaxID=1852016 RepID=A0ABS3BKK3_9BACT|nr:DUF4838 domain-containing protein [Algoriphagus aestuariicola]MBN7799818.1 hypothetical protein [Algoriphagus aestuariicola]
MKISPRHLLAIFCLIALCPVQLYAQIQDFAAFDRLAIVLGENPSEAEKRVAELLKDRILEKSPISITINQALSEKQTDGLSILLGRPENHTSLQAQFVKHRIRNLTELSPGPEGFLLQNTETNILLAAGIDERGNLYAVGELLRQLRYGKDQILLPENLLVRSAPAFEIRGTQFGQSGVAKNLAKVRSWTEEETQRVILDYALAGANIFSVDEGPMYEFIKSYGLMTQGGFGANTAPEAKNPKWGAFESIGREGYICPSVPEARSYMLEKFEVFAKEAPDYDLLKFHGGDGGGCECDRCDPYGLTFIRLVEDMATIFHRYHPQTRIYFTNQKFDNADDQAIFDYLNEKPREWLWAWGYGPGSDATTWQPGHRQTHRMDLFRYPGFGPYGLYPKEITRQMPARHQLVYYNEITHWKYAQHAYIQMYPRADKNGNLPPHWGHDVYERRPDQYLTQVYNRLTFFAWPRHYHRVFNDLLRYGVGDITHSSGNHDHFNQWMWQRLLWNPRASVEEMVEEYAKNWFGPEAAPLMAKAIFQLEENMEEIPGNPLPEKEGIQHYYELVAESGKLMPENWRQNNWLWRMYMQKAALDRYIQLMVSQQVSTQSGIEDIIRKNASDQSLQEALLLLGKANDESQEMRILKAEAQRLGEESDRIFGTRSEGFFNLNHDFIGLGWMDRQIRRALASKGIQRQEFIVLITDYENPGEGGQYDNLGTANHAPNVTFGYPYDHGQPYLKEMLSEGNRPSQRSMHFTQDEARGVTLHYRNLDPTACYKVRMTLVRPWYQERYAMRMNQKSETVFADGKILAKNLELPLQMSDFFTFNIPAELTEDGELVIHFQKAEDVANGDRVTVEQWRNSGGWGTLVSEVWLIRY